MKWLRRRLSRDALLTATITLLAALLAHGLGVTARGDAALVSLEYDVRGARGSADAVLLVAIDDEAIVALGPPPWSWDRLATVLEPILADGARTVVVLEPRERLAISSTPTAGLARAIADGRLIVPDAATAAPAAEVARGPITTVALRAADGRPTSTGRAAQALGEDGAAIAVNYLAGAGVPTISAAHVVGGLLPKGTFADRVVGVGVLAQPLAGLVPTPVGPLAPAQLQAEALASVADAAGWRGPSGWLVAAVAALLAVALAPRLRSLRRALAAIAVIAALELAGFFAGLQIGVTAPLVALGAALAMHHAHQRRATRARLDALDRVVDGLTAASLDPGITLDEQTFWHAVNDVALLQLGCLSWHVAELPPGGRHLHFTVSVGVVAGEIQERRRDVERAPYRAARLAELPVWHDGFIAPLRGLRTLLVPLATPDHQLGFWILDFPQRVTLSEATLRFIRGVGVQLAASLARRRGLVGAPRRDAGGATLGAALDRSLRRLGALADGLPRLADDLPIGLLAMSAFGEPRFVNDAMRRLLAASPPPAGFGVSAVITALTARPRDEVDRRLPALLRGEALLLSAASEAPAGAGVALSWLSRPSAGRGDEVLLLLAAIPGAQWGSDRLAPSAAPSAAAEPEANWLNAIDPEAFRTATIVLPDVRPDSANDLPRAATARSAGDDELTELR